MIKEFLKKTPISKLFWYSMTYICYTIIAYFIPELAIFLSAIGSIFLMFICVLASEDDRENMDYFWIPLTYLFWLALFVGGGIYCIIQFVVFIYNRTIKPFNRWLDSLRK